MSNPTKEQLEDGLAEILTKAARVVTPEAVARAVEIDTETMVNLALEIRYAINRAKGE